MAVTPGLADTGNKWTFAVTGFVGNIQSMQLPTHEFDMIDATHLSSDNFMEMIAGDVKSPGEVTLEVIFEQTLDHLDQAPGGWPITNGAPPLATITAPILDPGNNDTPATLTGTGQFRSFAYPNLANNELNVATIIFAFDGKGTKPTWTKETDSGP